MIFKSGINQPLSQGDKQDQDGAPDDKNVSQDDDNVSISTIEPDDSADDPASHQDRSWLEKQIGLTQEQMENNMEDFTIIGSESQKPDTLFDGIFQQVKVQDELIPSHSEDLDMKAFVEVFPCGTGGSTVDRPVKITKAQFEKTQLLSSDGNVRRNVQYHFHNMQQKEFRAVNQGIFQVSNKGSGKITKKQLKEGIQDSDENVMRKISTLLGNLPTQDEFWRRIRQKIEAMIDKYGPPTFWLTLSPGEYDDDELYAYLKEMNQDLPGVDKMKLSTLICKDPVLAGHYINKRFEATYDFIRDSEVIGQVGLYFSYPSNLKIGHCTLYNIT